MPNGSPRLYTHSVGGHGDVTRGTAVSNVGLSWAMSRDMTNAHVARRRRQQPSPGKSRVRDTPRSGAALACAGRMRWNRRNQTVSEEASPALISEGSRLEGTCSFNGGVVIHGHVKGEVHATGTLSIGRAGRVEARLRAPIVIVEG